MEVETSFPRGGSRPSKSHDSTFQSKKRKRSASSNDLKPKTLEPKPKNKINMVSAELLTYQKIKEGMLILGCIRRITSLHLEIELPGRIFGKVQVCDLSTPCVNNLEQKIRKENYDQTAVLQELAKIHYEGQIVPTKVIQLKLGDKTTEVLLSINPSDVNADLKSTSYKERTLIWAAVSSVLDHGYLLDVGNDDCRVFLPFENVSKDTKFEIGQTIWCVARSVNISSNICTMHVSAIPEEVSKATQTDFNLHNIIPCMQFDLRINKILNDGFEGLLSNNSIAYVNEVHFKQPLSSKGHKKNSMCKARLLYFEPLSKVFYLTLRRIDKITEPAYGIDSVLNAEVVSKTNGGIYVKLPNNDKGFVSDKRLLDSWNDKTKDDVQSFIKKKYPIGSKRPCKILSYNRFEQIYICTFQKDILKKESLNIGNLKMGELVSVVVIDQDEKGLVVKAGNVRGFIPNLHLSNYEFSDKIKSRFKDKQTLKVRVWDINQQVVYFTNKQTLINSNNFFTTYEDAKVNEKYFGVVALITNKGDALIIFYHNLRGILQKPKTTYFIGQVVLVTVVGKNEMGLILSLNQRAPKRIMHVGEFTSGVIEKIENDCLMVLTSHNITAKLPASHLSNKLSLNSTLFGTYKIGHRLPKLVCIEKQEVPIVSLREVQYKNNYDKSLKIGSVVRSFYDSCDAMGVNVSIPLKSDVIKQHVPFMNLSNSKRNIKLKLQPQQPIMLKVVEINEKDELKLSGKLIDVYDHDESKPLDDIECYLKNIIRIRDHCNQSNMLLGLCIGQRVDCVVKKCADTGCAVLINDTSVQGLVHEKLCPDDLKVGQKLQGLILWIDYSRNFVHLILEDSIIKQIAPVQDGSDVDVNRSISNAKILLVDDNFVIAVLQDAKTNNQLIFLPTFIHENSFLHKMDNYSLLEGIKVIKCRRLANFVIGLDKEFQRAVEKHLICNKAQKHTTVKNIQTKNSNLDCEKPSEISLPILNEKSNKSSANKKKKRKHNSDDSSNKATNKNNLKGNKALEEVEPVKESGFSSMSTFFALENVDEKTDEESNDESIEAPQKKKKKLSPAERAQLAKQQEEEIRKKEIENLETAANPMNPDQFDRLLLGKPNNSELWAKYIAYFVVQTEFEKARATARRALKTIDFNETEERYNIWMIMLNLENSHGDKSTFDTTFEEAVRCNNSLDIYLDVIKILAESQKFEEMEGKIKKVRAKFKDDVKMWTTIGHVYFDSKLAEQARRVRDMAIKSISNNKEQINMIVRFALLEFRFGYINEGEVLFETLLQNSPKKINVWCTYIDQVIKTGDIEKARRIFDRALAQDLPIKKKKSMCNRYKKFEMDANTLKMLTEMMDQPFV